MPKVCFRCKYFNASELLCNLSRVPLYDGFCFCGDYAAIPKKKKKAMTPLAPTPDAEPDPIDLSKTTRYYMLAPGETEWRPIDDARALWYAYKINKTKIKACAINGETANGYRFKKVKRLHKVELTSLDNRVRYFDSATQCARFLGQSSRNITNHIKNKKPDKYGNRFRQVEVEEDVPYTTKS